LHWRQFVAIFSNSGRDVFSHNHAVYLREFNEDDEQPGDPYRNYRSGTVLIKENYSVADGKPGAPLALTVMIKHRPGYDPRYGDWEYVKSSPDGHIVLRGNSTNKEVLGVCIGCHVNVAERDYIYSTFFNRF
jgi:hypothetical protein